MTHEMPTSPDGHPLGPVLYSRVLRQIADALDALMAFEEEDPRKRESSYFVAPMASLPIFNEEAEKEGKTELLGWLYQYDALAWIFVPYVEELHGTFAPLQLGEVAAS